MSFVHLHLHTIYSFLDGLVKPAELFEKTKGMGMKAVAATDHGNMHGAIDFYMTAMGKSKSLKDADVKPILGMESYISANDRTEKVRSDAFHLVLLARNLEGYRNLCYIGSKSYVDGFYYKPRIDRALLKEHADGLIALSACLGGEIPRALLHGRAEDAERIAREYQELFGKENFFIELQVNGIEDQEKVNPLLIDLARKVGAGLVATNDVHYLAPEHAEAQDILFCINEKKKVTDKDRMHHDVSAFYLKSEEEMRELFSKYGDAGTEAIENTWKIADRCNVELKLGTPFLPDFDTEGKSEAEYLKEISLIGLKERFEEIGTPEEKKQEYYDRLDYELGVISKMGYPGYFLIVSDFILWAKKNNIPVGPGRGSGAGSLVAYSTKITDLDPLRFGLFFERFLNPERISMPDFDIDFCQDKRELVIDYVSNKYGEKNVAQIATFNKLKAKSAIRDVARSLDIPLQTADKLAKLVPDNFEDVYRPQYGKKFKDFTKKIVSENKLPLEVADNPDLLKARLQKVPLGGDDINAAKSLITEIDAFTDEREIIRNNSDFSKIINIARQIEGLLRQPGKHACGLVIGQKPIFEYSPIFVDKEGYRVTQYDKNMVEQAGLVKFDFLGLKTLTMIDHAVDHVRKKVPDFDINKIPLDDSEVYRFLCEKSTKGVFQMESGGFEKMIHQMKPDRIEDLIAGVALYRPGPMDIIPNYIMRKHGREEIEYDHEWLEDILNETFGLIVYQEQVMQISQKMAGFTLGKADILRRAMGKKKAKDMESMKIQFIAGAKEKGVAGKIASKVFDHMEKFASYGFNKSHAACYGYISYQTAYLKTHYPNEFFAALISSESGSSDKVFSYISDAKSMGIEVYPPDINRSSYSFSIEENSIRFGFGAIKNVGEGPIEEIIRERKKNGPYESLIDFAGRINSSKVNSRTVEFLIKAGAFDFTGKNRGVLLSIMPEVLKEGEKMQADRESGQISLFDAFSSASSETTSANMTDDQFVELSDKIEEISIFESLAQERQVLGIYLSNHPAKLFKKDFEGMGFERLEDIIISAEEGGGYGRGRRNYKWVAGIITTDIKPAKGRDGTYYLKGVIESYDSAIEFAINRIHNPMTNPHVAKLDSKVPLIFKARVRSAWNKEDQKTGKVMLQIDDLEKDVMTIPEFIAMMREENCDLNLRAVLEMNEVDFVSNGKDIKKYLFNSNANFPAVPLKAKIDFGGNDFALLEKSVNLDVSMVDRYKQVFGCDKFYLLGSVS